MRMLIHKSLDTEAYESLHAEAWAVQVTLVDGRGSLHIIKYDQFIIIMNLLCIYYHSSKHATIKHDTYRIGASESVASLI